MRLTATRNGKVWGIAPGQHPDDFAVANEAGIVDGSMSQDTAMAEIQMACGRLTPIATLAANALIDGADAMCTRLAEGAVKVIAHLTNEDY